MAAGAHELQFLTKRRVASAIDKVVNFIKHDKAIKLVAIGDQLPVLSLGPALPGHRLGRVDLPR